MTDRFRFWVLTTVVAISGLSQGLLLPLIAIIFEEKGISSSINGLHATGIYIGVLLVSPFIEAPLHKYGFKPVILIGAAIVGGAILLFPIYFNLYFWFLLRLLIGVGDHMLHFSSQTWIGAISDPSKRGRNMSIYGLFFSVGFAVGPQLVNLAGFSQNLPFYLSGLLILVTWIILWKLDNGFISSGKKIRAISFFDSFKRFSSVLKTSWVAMIPPFLYGVLETGLNATFPVVGLREGMGTAVITIIISSFSVGTILFQLPIGIFSDRVGRGNLLPFLTIGGAFLFFILAFIHHTLLFILLFFILGIFLGSLYSLGLSYMTDLTALELLPAGNILVGMCFSAGSIVGPIFTGNLISHFGPASFYYTVAALLLVGTVLLFNGGNNKQNSVNF